MRLAIARCCRPQPRNCGRGYRRLLAIREHHDRRNRVGRALILGAGRMVRISNRHWERRRAQRIASVLAKGAR